MNFSQGPRSRRTRLIFAGLITALATAPAGVQTSAAAAAPSPQVVKQAIAYRKAVFTLIGASFRPLGTILQGRTPYQPVNVRKYAARVSFLSGLLDEAFPAFSQTGDTRAKAEIWTHLADFDKHLQDFREHAAALDGVAARQDADADSIKTALRAVAQDCKSCHDDYRTS